ncbi:hypothetical protein [Sphingobacterium gobiense]|uniref:Uncharacterized protein n=1 Tax=Sphingobacterium gobiense TaxID=1382456 RepID=A0A2S9JS30_9SPHI|nr:hypothetical protein [Sphingobacterium gobiense]PRD56018.1 hypothetical protein C5749_01640 [Sphingobacterium gobiense]
MELGLHLSELNCKQYFIANDKKLDSEEALQNFDLEAKIKVANFRCESGITTDLLTYPSVCSDMLTPVRGRTV